MGQLQQKKHSGAGALMRPLGCPPLQRRVQSDGIPLHRHHHLGGVPPPGPPGFRLRSISTMAYADTSIRESIRAMELENQWVAQGGVRGSRLGGNGQSSAGEGTLANQRGDSGCSVTSAEGGENGPAGSGGTGSVGRSRKRRSDRCGTRGLGRG